jgi:glycosyltransferase involved in cell wall biosynthesis
MLKIVSVVDETGSNIDHLAKGLIPYMDRFDYHVIDVHPKFPTAAQMSLFKELAWDAHVIDFQYPQTALMLIAIYPWLKDKKKVLAFYTPGLLEENDRLQFDRIIASNKIIHQKLQGSMYIPQTVDTNFWTFNPNWEANKNVLMMANPLEKNKGILEVAIACRSLGLKLILAGGAILDNNYFSQIMQTECVTFHPQINFKKLRELFYQSTVYICNSVVDFESHTQAILQAMLCGVPVLSRSIDQIPELYSKENLRLLQSDSVDNITNITKALKELIDNKGLLNEMREKSWKTAIKYADERRSYNYQRLYRSLFMGTPVSVIVTIYEYQETILDCLTAIAAQDYPNFELIICDDNPTRENETLVRNFAQTASFPVVYCNTSLKENDYGLARARNIGVIEASGEILVFCDQRIRMQPDAISQFVKHLSPHKWLYGSKGIKKGFVENFSCVYRDELIRAGMFCERLNVYGGMTQEIWGRTRAQGFNHEFVPAAKAAFIIDSFSLLRRRAEIISMRNRLFRMNL